MKRQPPSQRYCHSCGGPNPDPVVQVCRFCEGPLVPVGMPDPRHGVRCPGCHVLVASGSTFCPHCGTGVAEVETEVHELQCPGCNFEREKMVAWGIDPTEESPKGFPVAGCRNCGGAWVTRQTLDAIVAAAAEEAPPAGVEREIHRRMVPKQKVVYRKCPRCGVMMGRKNFARISGIVVDECREHGSFFDPGELQDVLEFVRSGGLHAAAKKQNQELARERTGTAAPAFGLSATSRNIEMGHSPVTLFARWIAGWLSD